MKNLIFILFIASLGLNLNAQDLKESDVPAAVKAGFSSLYPNITNVKWEMEHGRYEAEFKENSIETSIIFEANGTHLQTEVEIPVSLLPQGVSDYAVKNLAGKKITEGTKITGTGGKITYEAEIGGRDYIFDENGNFLRIDSDSDDMEDSK